MNDIKQMFRDVVKKKGEKIGENSLLNRQTNKADDHYTVCPFRSIDIEEDNQPALANDGSNKFYEKKSSAANTEGNPFVFTVKPERRKKLEEMGEEKDINIQ